MKKPDGDFNKTYSSTQITFWISFSASGDLGCSIKIFLSLVR